MKMALLEHSEAIEKRFWSAADTLRANSNYASNEYFLPVMGLTFLRHAYSRSLLVAGKKILRLFEDTVSPLHQLMELLKRQNVSLAKARDLLLPKLMNGEVAV
jgi:hypothetical protein